MGDNAENGGNHVFTLEMESKNSLDGKWNNIELNGNQEAGEDPQERGKTKEDDKNIIVEGGITYDDSDWLETQDTEGSKDDVIDDHQTVIIKGIRYFQRGVLFLWRSLNQYTKGYLKSVIFLLGYIAYFIAAMIHEKLDGEGSIRLLGCTLLGVIIVTRQYWMKGLRNIASIFPAKDNPRVMLGRRIIRWILNLGLLGFMVWVLIDQGMKNTKNLQPVPGLAITIVVCLIFSASPSNINWHTIYWSVGLQFCCALFILKFSFGRDAMQWLQDRFNEFFANTQSASIGLFGQSYVDHNIIFGAFPMMFFSNAVLTLLYYFGAIQLIINSIGTFLKFVLDISPLEATAAAGGIFLEGSLSVLSMRPYLGKVTKSQLFLITTSMFSSLGAAYIAILVSINVNVSDIIPAMLLSAPATFTVCKILLPESKNAKKIIIDSSVSEEMNNGIMELVQNAAVQMLSVLGSVVAIVFVFYSSISFINHTLEWFGDRVGADNLKLETIFGYLLYPVAMCMGVESDDVKRVATLLGFRIGSNNFVAFQKLTAMNYNRDIFRSYMMTTNYTGNYTVHNDDIIIGNQTLELGFINERSEKIVTYSLCGFSSILSVGLNLGILVALIPRRRLWIGKVFLAALIAGNVTNCMTGAFAGIFYYN